MTKTTNIPSAAVPDAIRAALSAAVEQMEHDALKIEMEWGTGRNLYGMEIDGDLPPALVQARAALSDTPAAAAPVVLPEPDDSEFEQPLQIQPIGVMGGGNVREVLWNCTFMPEPGINLYTEQQVRALLAGVSAPAAQADGFGSAEHWKEKAQYWAGIAHRMRQEALRGEHVDGIINPQAHADARDAERYRWLRECNSGSLVVMEITGTGDEDWHVLTEADADAAVDAAIAAQAAQQVVSEVYKSGMRLIESVQCVLGNPNSGIQRDAMSRNAANLHKALVTAAPKEGAQQE